MQVDRDLVRAVQRGEPAAMDALIRATWTDVYALARRLLHDDADAADATQEVFIKVVRSVVGFRGEAAFGTWLHRVTVNTCISAQRRRREATVPDRVLDEVADDHAGPERLAESHDLARRTAAALATLTEDARQVVVLRDVEGLTGRQVAELLGVTETVVKVRLHRAHARLRELLREDA